VALEPCELELLLAVPTDRWVHDEDVGDPASVRQLAAKGLLVSDDPDPLLAELRRRDERLTSPPWNIYAALHRAMTAWRDVEVAVSDEQSSESELAFELARGSPAFVERYGPPPPAFHSVGEPLPLPSGERDDPLYELLLARRTARGFDRAAALTLAELSTVLRYVWGCQGVLHLGEDVTVLKRTSPSGGSLHPIEVYPLVRFVEGLDPGLYHYSVERHALEPIEPLTEDGAEALARSFLGGQWYFSSAQVVFVLAARFDRSFWKYRDHDKAYSAILIDAGHLSQTLYLVCAELGLGAFVAGAINDATIDERLGLPAFREGSLVICGCGRPEPSGLEPRFDPYAPS
jgi:putative peptide maturation dehydrogenase